MRKLTREYLLSAPDELYLELVEHVQDVMADGPGRTLIQRLEALPLGLKMAWWVAEIDFEVPNGGFRQFFNNCDDAVETLQALRNLRLIRRAEVLERAMVYFEKAFGRPRDFRGRWFGDMPLDDTPEELALCYEYDDVVAGRLEPPDPAVAAYARKHPELFLLGS